MGKNVLAYVSAGLLASLAFSCSAEAAVTFLGATTSVSGGDATDSCTDSASGTNISSTCLLGGQQIASATVALSSPASGMLTAAGFPFDPGPDSSYDSFASAIYDFAVDEASTLSFSGIETIDFFANIHPPGPIDVPLSSFLTAISGSILGTTTNGFSGTVQLAPGSYRAQLNGSASGTDDSQGGTFDYVSGTTFADTLSFEIAPSPAPEAATWAMFIAGFGFVGATMRRQRRASETARIG